MKRTPDDYAPTEAEANVLAQPRRPSRPGPTGSGQARQWFLPDNDPYALYFRLAHTPNVPLLGVQIAAVKDAARTAWMKRPDQRLPLRVQLPGVRSLDVRDIGAWLAEALGADVIIDHTGREYGLILVLTPKAST